MIPRSWSDVARILVFLIPAIVLAFTLGRQARPATLTRDVIVSDERERVIVFTGAILHVATEARIEKIVAWKWRERTFPDGTVERETTAESAEREESRVSLTDVKVTLDGADKRKLRLEEHEKITIPAPESERWQLSFLFGLDGTGRRHYGASAGVSFLKHFHAGAWTLDPHRPDRAVGLYAGVRK